MTTPPHLKIVFRGTAVGTPEIWSISLKYDGTITGFPDLDADAFASPEVLSAGQDFFSSGLFDTRLQWEEWRSYKIKSDGHMEGNPKIVMLPSTDFVHGAQAPKYPLQIAMCITSVGVNRGPARYGRFFLPCVGQSMDGTSRLSQAAANAVVEQCSTFVKDVSGAIQIAGTAQNAPLINVSTIGAGATQEVDHLRCGRAFDTQRRRRNALAEEYENTGHIDW